jgi:hypothetical protein
MIITRGHTKHSPLLDLGRPKSEGGRPTPPSWLLRFGTGHVGRVRISREFEFFAVVARHSGRVLRRATAKTCSEGASQSFRPIQTYLLTFCVIRSFISGWFWQTRRSVHQRPSTWQKVIRVVSAVRRPSELEYEKRPDGRRIADTTTCRKPLGESYGDWFVACLIEVGS